MSRSLQCVKKHKMEHNCEGRRCKTAYTSLSEFDDAQLLSGKLSSDYVHPVHVTSWLCLFLQTTISWRKSAVSLILLTARGCT